ncbi:hypothetical protein D9M71_580950 [compost metagenome]
MREVFQHVDGEDLLAYGIGQVDAKAEQHVGEGQAVAGHKWAELAIALEGGDTGQQFGLGLGLDGVIDPCAEKCFGVAGAGRQFDVQLDLLGQLVHLGLGKNPFRQ